MLGQPSSLQKKHREYLSSHPIATSTCQNYTYGFHEEFLRRRSTVKNKIIKNLSSTSPSSNIALHSGPRAGSWSTLIGVIAKSRGTTSKTPEFYKEVNKLVTIASEEVTQTNQFRYFGSIIKNKGEIEEEVTNRIKNSL